MSYLEVDRGVNTNRIYRVQMIRYRIVSVLCFLLVVLGSVRCWSSDDTSSSGSGDSDFSEQEAIALEGWEASSKVAKDLTAIGFSVHPKKCLVYVKKHMTEEVTAPVSDSTVALSPTNSTENIDKYMVLWPEPELQFTISNDSDLEKLRTVLNDITVLKSTKAVFVYNLEYSEKCKDKLKVISQVINMLKCEALELRIEHYDSALVRRMKSVGLYPELTELQETIKYAGSNSERHLTINAYCLKPTMLDFSPLGIPQLDLASKLTLVATLFINRNSIPTHFIAPDPSSHEADAEAGININFTALHNQEIQCQKIVLINELDDLTLTGLENATQDIHSKIVLELCWDTLLCLIKLNNPAINVHTIIAIGPKSTKNLFPSELLQLKPPSTPQLIAAKISIRISTQKCWCLKDTYDKYYTPEVYAKYGISVGESTIEYEKRQNGLLHTLRTLEKNLYVDCKKSIKYAQSCGIKCPAEDRSNNNLELQEPVDINLKNLYCLFCNLDDDDCGSDCYHFVDIQPDIIFCQNIHYTDININGCDRYNDSEACQTLLSLFVNITAHTLRISNIYCYTVHTFNLSKIEGANSLPEIFRRRLNLKVLILDKVDDDLVYWILNNYIFADSMEVHMLNQSYKNLNIARILSYPKYQKISKLVLNGFVGLDEVKLYKEYKKEDRLIELPLFNYIETMKAKDKTTSDLGLNKLTLQLEGLDCNKYTEILAEFKNIGIQCEEVPLAVIVDRQIAKYNSCIRTDTQYALRKLGPGLDRKLVLRNINLQELEADLASRCAVSRSQRGPDQEQESPIQKLSIDKLSLYFSEEQVITENDLVKILDWIACQFTDLERLHFYDLKVSKDEKRDILTSNYYIIGINVFIC
ncbi:hypothetical protein NEHOM01_1961, partial [Nematocida homosporus]|uniref:uncharacterized protein n=1 Tax=Nematocida homosporus TaxID=1912981 RepID=UPI00221EEDFD